MQRCNPDQATSASYVHCVYDVYDMTCVYHIKRHPFYVFDNLSQISSNFAKLSDYRTIRLIGLLDYRIISMDKQA